ncbi:MAG TPA: glycine--tRNA ligase subunit beta [Thermoanaerobaculia bacterium]|nr:glycine--tRNA ligase subunit beta [Thermoanaerobaculia bacterium]
MSELLIEVLAEEIPAGVLPAARNELLQKFAQALGDARINGTFFVHSTSRRLILVGKDLPEMQPDFSLEVTGPPASAAFDAEKKPTRAAEGFAKSHGVPVESLTVTTTPKGDYVMAKKVIEGRPTPDVVAEILPPLLSKMTFPRMMRWGAGEHTWVRPVHSIVALFDGMVVPFVLFGVESGRVTVGHRTLSGERVVVTGVDDYFTKVRAKHVEPDYAIRHRALGDRALALSAEVSGEPASDPALMDTLAHLVETPGLVRGAFDAEYLALPEEILVTTMREHQKVLPVRGADGALLPHFLAVMDHEEDPKGLIVRGNEWVVNARFADARFFYEDDGKVRLEERLSRLQSLQFQEKLGDYLRKTGRIQELAERLATRFGRPELGPSVVRAARLLKADLVTDMVREFPDLQGVVGGLYARREGEPEEVWQAIYDQYRPASFDDDSPRGDVGAIVALADRLDTLTGLFGLGLSPTGSKDPYALRRAAIGIVKILLDRKFRLDLPVACSDALLLHGPLPKKREEVLPELNAFLLDRLRNLLERRGHRPDEIEAVLSTECRDLADAAERVAAISAMRKKEDFAPLATSFKRVQNILAQAPEAAGEPDLSRMTDDAEKALALDYLQARGILDDLVSKRKYEEALGVMASLGPSLDRFFVEVLVMAEDPAVKKNRVALLRSMRDQFARVAHFNEMQG